jgi:hypothetical protein
MTSVSGASWPIWCIGENVNLTRTGGSDVKRSEIVAAMRQAAREAEAGLYGESEEAAAYARHIATKLERVLGQIEPEMDIPTCADFPT